MTHSLLKEAPSIECIYWRGHTSAVAAPASCSRKIPMICSSLNRLRFIVRLLPGDGLYSILEEFSGLRSRGARTWLVALRAFRITELPHLGNAERAQE